MYKESLYTKQYTKYNTLLNKKNMIKYMINIMSKQRLVNP